MPDHLIPKLFIYLFSINMPSFTTIKTPKEFTISFHCYSRTSRSRCQLFFLVLFWLPLHFFVVLTCVLLLKSAESRLVKWAHTHSHTHTDRHTNRLNV